MKTKNKIKEFFRSLENIVIMRKKTFFKNNKE